MLFFLKPCFVQGMEGVFKLELEAWNGKTISRASSFLLKSPFSEKTYLVTSFHLLNANLMDAKRLKLVDDSAQVKYLDIAYYDELNDIMLLDAENIKYEGFRLAVGSECDAEQSVVGYHNNELFSRNFIGYEDTEIKGAYRIPIYLRNGFSGSPVLNSDANVCSMVVLSSERNASSVVISGEIIARAIKQADEAQSLYNISKIRQLMGLEKVVRTQAELDSVISLKGGAYIVLNIDPEIVGSDFRIREGSNLIVLGSPGIANLIVDRSNNVMLRELNPDRIVLNESSGVSVTACVFNKKDKAVYIRNSDNYSVYGNLFKDIHTGIVLNLNDDKIEGNSFSDFDGNSFQNVINRVSNI
jgi:hypothetical protein